LNFSKFKWWGYSRWHPVLVSLDIGYLSSKNPEILRLIDRFKKKTYILAFKMADIHFFVKNLVYYVYNVLEGSFGALF
jgi:hypothetical protein